MAIRATFEANFQQWDTAVKNAQQNLKEFANSTAGVQQRLQRVFSEFDGSKLIGQTTLMTSALQRLGKEGKTATDQIALGLSRLTDEEFRRVNASVTATIQKFNLLGKEVPADIRLVQTELGTLQARTAQVGQASTGLTSTLGGLKTAFAGAFAGFTAANLLGSAVRGVQELARDIVALGGELVDLSAKTGVSMTALQRWKYAAEQNGNTIDQITLAVGQLQKRIGGNESAVIQALTTLGLKFEEIRRLSPERQFEAVAEALARVEDQNKKAALAMDLFGRSGLEVLPTITAGMKALGDEAERLGIVISENTLRAMDEFDDTLGRLKLVGTGFIAEVLGPMVTRLTDVANAYLRAASAVDTWANTMARAPSPMVPGLGIAAAAGYAYAQSPFDYRANLPRTPGSPGTVAGLATGQAFVPLSPEAAQAMMKLDEKFKRQTEATQENTAALKANRAALLKVPSVPSALANLTGPFAPVASTLNLTPTLFGEKGAREIAQALFATALPVIPSRDTIPLSTLIKAPSVTPGPQPTAAPTASLFGADFGGRLGQTMLAAFTGGGDLGKSIGGLFGGQLTKGIGESVGKWAGSLTSGFGKVLGGALGSIIPGLGTLFGGALGDWIGGLFGGDSKKTKQMREDFLAQAGGLDEVRKMADYAGVSIDRLLNTKKSKEFEREVRKLEAAFAAVQKRVQGLVTELGTVQAAGGLLSGDLANRLLGDFDKPEIQQAFKTFVTENLTAATTGLQRFLEVSKDLPLTAKSAEAFGGALAGLFQRMRELGATSVAALKALTPTIDALVVRLKAAGLEGGAAFADLQAMAALATDEVAGPLLEGVDSLTQAMVGLSNAGLLTEDMFQGLAEQIGVTWDRLIREGKSGDQALRLMAPSLQRLWELQQKWGWAVDDTTQALIDQAKEQGLVGEHMKDVMSQVLDVLKAIAKVLGADIPEAAKKAAEAIDQIEVPEIPPIGGKPSPTNPPPEPYARGGLVPQYLATGGWPARGTDIIPAMLSPGEYVVSAPAVRRIGTSALEALNRGALPDSGQTINISIAIDTLDTQSVRQAVEQDIAPALVEVLRQNVRGIRTETRYALGVS